jgi:hypothetical protein
MNSENRRVWRASGASVACLLGIVGALRGQQTAVPDYHPPVPRPAYAENTGPRIGVDEAHHNYHTAGGRYRTFAELLRRDGYRVNAFREVFVAAALSQLEVLVSSNPLHVRNLTGWTLPTPSAFTAEEIAAVRLWVENGGGLLLIADHMPFPGAAGELAAAFGVTFSNGYARDGRWGRGRADRFVAGEGLMESAVTRGRFAEEAVTEIATFGGSAFKPPVNAVPILVFGPNSISQETTRAPGISLDARKVEIEGWCQGAVLKVGKGRVAIFGEAAMFTAQVTGPDRRAMGMNAPEAPQNHQLLLNVLHWLTRAEGMADR